MIYLDNAATTMVCREACEAAVQQMCEDFGNPSSTHIMGRTARKNMERARSILASSLSADPGEIFFTSGGTEGNNWALLSGSQLMRHKGRHIISSMTEHDSVRETLKRLSAQGWDITLLTPTENGSISPDAVAGALRPDTVLVSLMLVNNETGAVTDIAAVAGVIRSAGSSALLHTDAVQGFMRVPVAAGRLHADMITVSGHKIHAPKGIGALYVRKGLRLPPLHPGGGQENGFRSGTENLPGICAFAAAAAAFGGDRSAPERMKHLRSGAAERLASGIPGVVIQPGIAPHILSISIPGYRSEVLLNYLDAKGICVSQGSACKRGRRSHVLEAMGLPPEQIDGTIRVSLSRFTTADEIDTFCTVLKEAVSVIMKTTRPS